MPIDVNDLNPEFARRMALLLRDANVPGASIESAFRSVAQQAAIRAAHEAMPGGVEAHPAAPAGGSMHNFGLATDVSGPGAEKLRAFVLAHPEYGITANVKNDPYHFQMAGDQHLLMAKAPVMDANIGVDPDAVKKYLARFFPGGTGETIATTPGAPVSTATATPTPVPTTTPGITLNTSGAPNLGSVPGGAVPASGSLAPAVTEAPATTTPTPAELIGKGDIGGAINAAGNNPLVSGGISALQKGLSGGGHQSPAPMQVPQLQDNSAAIAQQAPSMMAALLAQIRARQQPQQPQGIPGMTLNRRQFPYG